MKTKKLLLWTVAAMLALPLHSITFYVRSVGGIDINDGLSTANPFLTFSKALSVAISGDTINLEGTFSVFNQTMNKSLTIQGTSKDLAIFDGTAGNATTKPFTGTGTVTPGTIYTFENVTFQNYNNSVFTPGPSYSIVVKNAIFKDNSSTSNGGAIAAGQTNLVQVEDSYFYNNSSTNSGGAISVSSGAVNSTIIINRCLFDGNMSNNGGGSAISYAAGAISGTATAILSITNSTFTGNRINYNATGSNMGAININASNTGVDAKLINNTIAYNTTGSTGAGLTAGLYVRGMTNLVTLINNIIYSNLDSQTTPASTSILNNTGILLKESRNNITDMSATAYDWATKTTSGSSSGNISDVTNDQLKLAPALSDNSGKTNTLLIESGSVAINAGYATGAPLIDQRNVTRIGTPDIGAYETSTPSAINTLKESLNLFLVEKNNIVSKVDGTIQLISISGTTLKNIQVKSGDLISLPKGAYLVRLFSDKGNYVQKVIL